MKGTTLATVVLLPIVAIAALVRSGLNVQAGRTEINAAQRSGTLQTVPSAFKPIEIWIDSHDQPLAAYQLEFKAVAGAVKIVGIEGGEPAAFRDPPYYDPAAMQQERVIIGAFSTAAAANLPVGKMRIATIHVQVTGDSRPEFSISLTACATVDGKVIAAEATLMDGQSS